MERKIKYLFIIILAFITLFIAFSVSNLSDIQENSTGWNYQQLTLFSHSKSNFTFTFSGDERDDGGNFAKMINNINSNFPDVLFNINGGDLRSNAAQISDFKKEYLIPGSTAHFNKPVMFIIGNHEIVGDPTKSAYQSIFGKPTYYNFTENNSYFIIVDNSDESVNNTQLNWLKDQLKLSQNYKYRFIFLHTPLYTPSATEDEHGMKSTGLGGADALKTLFDDNNVTMIFASHIHNYYNGTWGKTPFIISGGAGAPPENNHPPNHHYIVISVSDKEVTYQKVAY